MIAVVVPTIRPESMKRFEQAWQPLFDKHQAKLITVWDGDNPTVEGKSVEDVMGKHAGAIVNRNGGIRNLGFAYVAKYMPDVEYIITLDDDTLPIGDPIADHLWILNQQVPVSWFSTASEYMRGFPYKVRNEAEVVLSHGVWEGVADWDAPTQLVKGSHRPVQFPRCPVPKGAYFPLCIMNVGFKRKMLPYMYQFPPAEGVARADDIWSGIVAKRAIDKNGWAAVTGYARVHHERESNVYKNLQDEGKFITLNETFWQGDESDPYFKIYKEKYQKWQAFLKTTSV